MRSRPFLIVIVLVMAVVFASWALGELLRQRKTTKRRKKR